MFDLLLSNRFETLLDGLLSTIGGDADDPFRPVQIVVPNAALQRRVQLAIADRSGICANVEFSYLGQWLWTQIGRVVPVAEQSPFAPAALRWRIFDILGESAFVDPHTRLAAYLRGRDPLMRDDLAGQVAHWFDQAITYRPDWLDAWAAGRAIDIAGNASGPHADEAWLATLWRELLRRIGVGRQHPATAFFAALAADDPGDAARRALPAAVEVFCVPSIAPLYRDILRRLSDWVTVRVYLLSPSREYWFDLVDPGRLARLRASGRADHHEVVHPLLAGWGQATQASLRLLLASEGDGVRVHDLHDPQDPGHPTAGQARAVQVSVLHRLQSDILRLAEPRPGTLRPAQDDRSIEVHRCHSLTRQLEVLHDRLLGLFAADHSLMPEQVLVVLPDPAATAPLIDAVFGTAPADRRIPYRITGLGARSSNPIAHALSDLLRLVAGRLPAGDWFAWLEQAPVAARYGLSADDLDRIRVWLVQAGVHWGLDAGHRASLGLPAEEQHSFADGLGRLFLSYASGSAADGAPPFGGRLPAADPQGQEALALGAAWRCLRDLGDLRERWSAPRDAAQWRDDLLEAMNRCVADTPAWAEDTRAARSAISSLSADMTRALLSVPLALNVLSRALEQALDEHAHGGVPTGDLTFSAIGALRGLPYRVVCAIGLEDQVFPGQEQPREFDLMAWRPREGDRQRRVDDRDQFLWLLLSAREVLHLSFNGRSVRDNAIQPPSVLVAELLDHLALLGCERSDDPAAMTEARARYLVDHPLQPFSPRYFAASLRTDPRLVSFDEQYRAALAARARVMAADIQGVRRGEPSRRAGESTQRMTTGEAASEDALAELGDDDESDVGDTRPFFERALAPPPPAWRQVSPRRLAAFLRRPCGVLLRERLGIRLADPIDEIEDEEPFSLAGARARSLADRLLPAALAGAGADALTRLARAGIETPAGAVGDVQLARLAIALRRYADALATELREPVIALEPLCLAIDLEGEAWTLEHLFTDVRVEGLLRYRYRTTRLWDLLDTWVEHLCLCALDRVRGDRSVRFAPRTRWHGADGIHAFDDVPDAVERLHELVGLYRRGLSAPLHFFARSAWEYVSKGGNLSAARAVWMGRGDRGDAGESAQDDLRIALRGDIDPLDGRFQSVAFAVLGPLIAHLSGPGLPGGVR